jgi:hypothetical protein
MIGWRMLSKNVLRMIARIWPIIGGGGEGEGVRKRG